MDQRFDQVASENVINKTAEALRQNGFVVNIVEDKVAAKAKVISLIPRGAEVFTNTSVTLDEADISDALNGPDYISIRSKIMELLSDPSVKKEMKQVASVAKCSVGSVHAVTEDGSLMIASYSGSQFPGYSYGSDKVLFVVGAQKIVKDFATGLKRIKEYSVPLEDVRAMAAYGSGTKFNKLLVINADAPERITVIIIKENVGY